MLFIVCSRRGMTTYWYSRQTMYKPIKIWNKRPKQLKHTFFPLFSAASFRRNKLIRVWIFAMLSIVSIFVYELKYDVPLLPFGFLLCILFASFYFQKALSCLKFFFCSLFVSCVKNHFREKEKEEIFFYISERFEAHISICTQFKYLNCFIFSFRLLMMRFLCVTRLKRTGINFQF